MPETISRLLTGMTSSNDKVMLFMSGKPLLCKILDSDEEFIKVELGMEGSDQGTMNYLIPKAVITMICYEGDKLMDLMKQAEPPKAGNIVTPSKQIITPQG